MKPEVAEEITGICDRPPIDIGTMTLVFGAAGIIKVEYVDSTPEPMSEEHIFERILDGITGEEDYIYDAQAFAEVVKAIEQNPEIGGKQHQKLLSVIPQLKRAFLNVLI